jgi:mannose/fructose/N-acetylgalactosamine-specific phosphotransferase system component IIC
VSVLEVLPVALLGAVCGLDFVSFPQAMISRPIVGATAGAAILGSPAEGLLIGVVLELLALDTRPFGASRYPEWGTAGVTGGAVFASVGAGRPGGLAVAVFVSLVTAMLSGSSMVVLRKLIGARAAVTRELIEAGSERAVVGLQLFGLTADLLRGFILTLLAVALAVPLARGMVGVWGLPATFSNAAVIGLAGAVAGGSLWKFFTAGTRTGWLFLAGLVIGLGLVAVQ